IPRSADAAVHLHVRTYDLARSHLHADRLHEPRGVLLDRRGQQVAPGGDVDRERTVVAAHRARELVAVRVHDTHRHPGERMARTRALGGLHGTRRGEHDRTVDRAELLVRTLARSPSTGGEERDRQDHGDNRDTLHDAWTRPVPLAFLLVAWLVPWFTRRCMPQA